MTKPLGKGLPMIELWSATKLYLPFAALGLFIVAESTGFDPRDLSTQAPTAVALIIVVFAFLRRLDPMLKAINKLADKTAQNTAVCMEIRNFMGKDKRYSDREIAEMAVSAKMPSDD